MPDRTLIIGQLSARAGLPISTLHFYERRGLICAHRDGANRRVYPRDTADWERLSVIWHADLTARIETLTALRDKLGSRHRPEAGFTIRPLSHCD